MSEYFNPLEWITTGEAAELTGYSRVAFQKAQENGRIYSVKRGKTRFFKKSDILAYVAQMQSLGNKKHALRRPRPLEKEQDATTSEVNTIDENEPSFEWITTTEATILTGYSRDTFYKAYKKGQLTSIKRGKTRFFKKLDILAYVEKMQALGSQKHTRKEYRKTSEAAE